jgi:hypothetical protein
MTGLLSNAGFDMVEEKAELSVWMLCAAFCATSRNMCATRTTATPDRIHDQVTEQKAMA